MSELRHLISQITQIKERDFTREGDGREVDLSEVKPEISEIILFAKLLDKDQDLLNTIPAASHSQIQDALSKTLEQYSAVLAFNIKDYPNPIQNFIGERIAEIRSIHQTLFPFITFTLTKNSQNRLSNKVFEKLEERATDSLQIIEEKMVQVEEVLEGAKKIATKTTLENYQSVFNEEAKRNKFQAIVWGFLLVLTAVFLGLRVFSLLQEKLPALETAKSGEFVSFLILKLFGITVLIYILQLVARNYFAIMHQWSLNKHRSNVLGVFDAIVDASTSPEVKDAILTLMARAIFESGDTGFISGKDMSHDGPDYIQFAKDITSPGK